MSSRGNNSTRAIQKKLRKVVKDALNLDEMQGVVEGALDPIPAMEIFMTEEGIDKYGDDVLEFKADVEKCCKFISKMRGKKASASVILEEINAMLEAEFPGVFSAPMEVEDAVPQSSKKRGRLSTDSASIESPDRQQKKKATKHTDIKEEGMSVAEKTALKAIVAKISKSPDAEYFLYPVDAKSYPEYYELISHPMDLDTVKQNLNHNHYNNVEEALQDIRVIWENCRTFNAEGSEILLLADSCADMLESLVEEKLGAHYVQTKKKSKGGKKSKVHEQLPVDHDDGDAAGVELKTPKQKRKRPQHQTNQSGWPIRPRTYWPVSDDVALSRSTMKNIIKDLSASEFSEYFLSPVDLGEAPGYLELIETPMDLSTMKKRIGSGLYDNSASQFAMDMRLIWENCVKYNDPASEIAVSAASLGEVFEETLGSALSEITEVEADANVQILAQTSAGKPKARKVKEEDIANDVEDSGKKTVPVAKKHKGENENGDVEEPKKPLSANIKKMKRILKEMYKDDRSLPFREPVPVDEVPGYAEMIPNPMDLSTVKANLYSYEDSPAAFLRDMHHRFDNCRKFNLEDSDFYRNAGSLRDIVDQLYNEAFPPFNPDAAKKHKGLKGENENGEAEEPKKPLSANIKKMKRILKEMYKDDRSLPFREPVPVDEVPGYAEMIPNPMDLSTVKANLFSYEESPGKFLRDMRLIFDNCRKFNVEDSDIYKNAGNLLDMVDQLYKEAFPPVDPAVEAAMKIKIAAKARKASTSEGVSAEPDASANAAAAATIAATTLKLPAGSNSSSTGEVSESNVALPIPVVKVPPRMQSLPTKLADLVALANELSSSDYDAGRNALVRERAFHRAYEKLRATRLPFVVVPDLYVVRKFGDLYPDLKCHDENYIYPIQYTCSRVMRICVIPENGTGDSITTDPWVSVEVKSVVACGGGNGNETCFQVALENGTVLTESASPREAWDALRGKELQVMEILGGKLKRCRAVFNRLAVSPDALPFLDMVPLTGAVGQSYYAATTAPMWFREVHTRLVEGTYDVEFDFAWDMRLIFKNCMEYNLPGSELYEAAVRLGVVFEHLFTHWVLNVQDRSVDSRAQGPWDQWFALRFFDLADPTENICSVTGTRAPASQLLQCRCCEDQQMMSLHPPVQSKSLWVCPRCQVALDMADGDLTGNPFSAVISKPLQIEPFSTEEFGGNFYVPAPEFGIGWSQAKRRQRAGLKNTFLSPLGYEVSSKEDIPHQIAYEDIVNQNLYTARAAEFQEYIKTINQPRNQAKKTARHKRVVSEAMSPEKCGSNISTEDARASTTIAPPIDPLAAEEVGRIPTGKLDGYEVPSGCRVAWFVSADEENIIQKASNSQDVADLISRRCELLTDILPPSGYFGFDIPAIRGRIEGLEGSMTCTSYTFKDTAKYRDAILDDVRAARDRIELMNSSEEALRKVLTEERLRFSKQLLIPPRPANMEDKTSFEHKSGFSPLFPQTFGVEQCDTLVALWEFMYFCPTLYKSIDTFSLYDLICSLTPPPNLLPTYGQVVFDEVCCNLTSLLFGEVRCRSDLKEEFAWQEVLHVRPMNIVTWPTIALEAVRLLTFPLSSNEIGNMLDINTVPAHVIKQRDILCLLLNHPVIDTFLVQITATEGQDSALLNKVTLELRAMKDHFSNVQAMRAQPTEEQVSYSTVELFCLELRKLFLDVLEMEGIPEQRTLHAQCLVLYLSDLYKRWGVEVESVDELVNSDSRRTAEEMEAQLNAEKLSPWRFWGGYTLSNIEIPKGQVLTTYDFSTHVVSDYSRRMKSLAGLEKCLVLLPRTEPESWSMSERTIVYSVLMDLCMVCREFVASAHHRQNQVNVRMGTYTEAPGATEHVHNFEVVKHTPPGAKCHFTGITVDHSLDRVQWVAVPPAYLNAGGVAAPAAMPIDAGSSSAGGRGTRSVNNTYTGPVALQMALVKIIAAREAAQVDAQKYEHRVISVLQPNLYEDPKKTVLFKQIAINRIDPLRSLSYCSQPLGYDRHGNAYWLLSAQEVSTIFPYQPNGSSMAMGGSGSASGKNPLEPCVLTREPNGWWGCHNGVDVPVLMSSFSSDIFCERVLILRMIEKLVYTRCLVQKTVLCVRAMQREWILRRIRTELWINNVKLPSEDIPPAQMNRLLELMWARCAEVRNQLHTSSMYKHEDDPPVLNSARAEKDNILRKQKKYRDVLTDDTFEFHGQKGWERSDALQKIRQTAASTTATRLIADPTAYPSLFRILQSSSLLVRNVVVPAGQAGAGEDEDGEAPAAQPKAVPALPTAVSAVEPKVNIGTQASVETGVLENGKDNKMEVEVSVEDSVENQTAEIAASVSHSEVREAVPEKEEQEESTAMDVVGEGQDENKDESVENIVTASVTKDSAPSENITVPAASEPVAAPETSAPVLTDTIVSEPVPAAEPPAAPLLVSPVGTELVAATNSSSTEPTATASAAVPDPTAVAVADENSSFLPDLRAIMHVTCDRKPNAGLVKAVEMIHNMTGDLIRIFPTGKDAAAFLNTAQSGISLCLHSTKADYLGYRWRTYYGPPIDWDALALLQPSPQLCTAMQVTKPMKQQYDMDRERRIIKSLIIEERKLNPALYVVPPALTEAIARNTTAIPRPVPGMVSLPPVPGSAGAASVMPPRIQFAPPQPAGMGYQPPRPGMNQPAMTALAPIITSVTVVSARMLRIKAELLNIFYLLPEKALRLPELDAEGEKQIADAGAEAAASIRAGLAKLSSNNAAVSVVGENVPSTAGATATMVVKAPAVDCSTSNVERLADKAARKAKRRLRRKLSMEKFLSDVQNASTPQQLLNTILCLESALPMSILYKYHKQQLPTSADALSAAAVRLYTLDRVIAYDEIRSLETQPVQCPYRLRFQFYPRCVIVSGCSRYMGHTGKCAVLADVSSSRIPDFQDTIGLTRSGNAQFQYTAPAPMPRPVPGQNGSHLTLAQQQALAAQRRMAYMQQMAALKPKDEDLPLEEVLKKLLQVRKELDIEQIQPYFPIKEITASDWV